MRSEASLGQAPGGQRKGGVVGAGQGCGADTCCRATDARVGKSSEVRGSGGVDILERFRGV